MLYQFPGLCFNISLKIAPVDIVLKNRYDPKILKKYNQALGKNKKKKDQN